MVHTHYQSAKAVPIPGSHLRYPADDETVIRSWPQMSFFGYGRLINAQKQWVDGEQAVR